ncbi:MAG TPA: type II secretion system minor pseudopilin GspK [Rudaea sp.]|nr:type II secretion system minor pseudopilin GspK [Rudaea sp.]
MSIAGARQRGVALIVALLVVALATVLIAALLDRGELTAARTRNQLRAGQARAYSLGLEAYAAKVLNRDDAGNDASDDIWALPLPPTPVPGGEITAIMSDLNGRFNLNNLDPRATNTNQAEWEKKFGKLLRTLGLDQTLTGNIIAWMNPGSASGGANASDGFYLGQTVPYRAAQREFMDVSELRLVKGVNGDVYTALAPYVSALPMGTTININTASVPVLMTLTQSMTEAEAQPVWQQGHAKFASVADAIKAQPALGGMIECPNCYSVRSSYFLARGEITLDQLPFTFYSLLERRTGTTTNASSGNGVRVLQRRSGADF